MLCRQYRRSPLWPAQCMRRRHQQAAAVAASRPSSSALPLWWGTGWRKRRATLGTLPSVQRLCRCDPVSHWHSGNCIYVSLYSDASNQSRRGLSTTPPQSMHYCQCNNSTYYYSARGRASPILIVTSQQRAKNPATACRARGCPPATASACACASNFFRKFLHHTARRVCNCHILTSAVCPPHCWPMPCLSACARAAQTSCCAERFACCAEQLARRHPEASGGWWIMAAGSHVVRHSARLHGVALAAALPLLCAGRGPHHSQPPLKGGAGLQAGADCQRALAQSMCSR